MKLYSKPFTDRGLMRCSTWCLHSLVVVRVDAHFVLLCVEGVLAHLHRPQLVVGLQVRPAPQTTVYDMGEAFSVGHLETAIEGPVDRRKEGSQWSIERPDI